MNRHYAHELLSPAQFLAIAQLLEVLPGGRAADPIAHSLARAPVEDEEIAAETQTALERVRISLARGQGVPHEEILREFGLIK